MDATAKKLLKLLDSDDLELRVSAAQVFSELGISSKPVIKALGKCLREPYEPIQFAALKGLARLGASDVAHLVVPMILKGGDIREHVMAVVAAIGPSAVPQLRNLYDGADFNGRRAIITSLSVLNGKPAVEFMLNKLAVESFEQQQHLLARLAEAINAMKPAQQTPIFPLVQKLLRGKPDPSTPYLHISGLILLGCFRGRSLAARARKILRNYADPKHLPEIRRFALVSLYRQSDELKATPDFLRFLQKSLCDSDWENVAQHALTGFKKVDLNSKDCLKLVQLLNKSPHFTVHIHVFERLTGINRPEIASAIVPFLSDSRFRVREAAEAALRQISSGIESLFKTLVESEDLEVTQRVNSILQEFPQKTRRKYLDRAVKRLLLLFERNDVRYRSFLEFVKGIDPEPLRTKVHEKVLKLKNGASREKWARICIYMQLLWDNHMITSEGRYHFAIALIRQSARNLDPASRRSDLGLRVLRALIYDSYEELVEKIVADKQLKPDDFYYLGFHFAEESEQMGQFGVRMLQHLVEAFPRSQICPQAEQKLKLHLPEEQEEVTEKKPSRKKAASKSGSSVQKGRKASGKKKSGSSRRVTINVSASTSAARKAKSPRKKASKS
tara:strand:- start:1768 stop:3612 length:1845 start_codon:yes stop_codon:yes gene_type:complete